jgi:hypothetical protein
MLREAGASSQNQNAIGAGPETIPRRRAGGSSQSLTQILGAEIDRRSTNRLVASGKENSNRRSTNAEGVARRASTWGAARQQRAPGAPTASRRGHDPDRLPARPARLGIVRSAMIAGRAQRRPLARSEAGLAQRPSLHIADPAVRRALSAHAWRCRLSRSERPTSRMPNTTE